MENGQRMPDELFTPWFKASTVGENVRLLAERSDSRDSVMEKLIEAVADSLVDLEVIDRMGGFEKAAHVLRGRLPTSKKARSADFGEILATEYVQRQTDYSVPVKRLRYKDDRSSSLRGDDVVGIKASRRGVRVLKAEAKSRASLSDAVVEQARTALAKDKGRPNPSTLAFLEYILRKEGRDDEAQLLAALQQSPIRTRQLRHLVFTVSGNNPRKYLEKNPERIHRGVDVDLVGCQVRDHGQLVADIFDKCMALGGNGGNS